MCYPPTTILFSDVRFLLGTDIALRTDGPCPGLTSAGMVQRTENLPVSPPREADRAALTKFKGFGPNPLVERIPITNFPWFESTERFPIG